MKRILFILLTMVAMVANAQTIDFPATEYTQDPKANYRLYKTKNNYTFIKLDTRTGQMELVQWSTKNGHSFTYTLSNEKRVYFPEDEIPGRFTLYATTNFYNFVLLDQIDGRTWQVQWGTEKKYRLVKRLYYNPEIEIEPIPEPEYVKDSYKEVVSKEMVTIQHMYGDKGLKKSNILKAYIAVIGKMMISEYKDDWDEASQLNSLMRKLIEEENKDLLQEVDKKLENITEYQEIISVFNAYAN